MFVIFLLNYVSCEIVTAAILSFTPFKKFCRKILSLAPTNLAPAASLRGPSFRTIGASKLGHFHDEMGHFHNKMGQFYAAIGYFHDETRHFHDEMGTFTISLVNSW